MKPLSIKSRVTFIATAALLGLLALVSAVQLSFFKVGLRQVLESQQFTLVSRVADDIDQTLMLRLNALVGLAKILPADELRRPTAMQKNLENRPGLQSEFDALSVIAANGKFVAAVPYDKGRETLNLSDRPWIREVLDRGRPIVSPPHRARLNGEPQVVLGAPIFGPRGEVVGVLAGTLNLFRSNFLGNIGRTPVGRSGSFGLLTKDRLVVMSVDKDRIMTQGPAPGASPFFDHAVAGAEGTEESVGSGGLHALFSYKSLQSVPWVLVAALPVEEAYAPFAAAQRQIVQFMVVVALLLAPLIWLGVRSVLKPLLALHQTIRSSRNDPGAVPEVPVREGDEIGDLAADFNALMRERNEAAAALQDNAHRLRLITDNTPALISYVDSGERYQYANATYHEWFGMTPEEVCGRTMREVLRENYPLREPHIRDALAGKEARFDLPISFGGSERHTHTRYVPDVRSDGGIAGFYVLATDVTPLKRTEQMLRESEQRLSLALESSQLALFDWNIATNEIFLSEQWALMLGGKPAPTRTTFDTLERMVHPKDATDLSGLIRDALKGVTPYYRAEHRVRRNDGKWIWIQSHGQVTARGPDGQALRLIGTNADVTERKRAEADLAESRAQLERAAQYDGLTGLPNRNLLGDRLEQALARARRNRQLISLFYLDLDRFKDINDARGHAAGDALLKAFAERLNACVRETDTVARLGGDEFVILLEDVREDGDARAVADKIIDAMRREFHVDSKALRVTTSIGVAFTRGDTTSEDLMKQADAALYEAKGAGRNRYHVARPALEVVEGRSHGRGAKPGHSGKS
ncbi:MAG TPA: diguanylate cyclase [Burkholderiales bacterium]|nr:diguanylate cyclase [Burkholderiales bacterium]